MIVSYGLNHSLIALGGNVIVLLSTTGVRIRFVEAGKVMTLKICGVGTVMHSHVDVEGCTV